jgi:hypothetical protein
VVFKILLMKKREVLIGRARGRTVTIMSCRVWMPVRPPDGLGGDGDGNEGSVFGVLEKSWMGLVLAWDLLAVV